MKTEVDVENVELKKEMIKPFKKLNKRIFRAVIITLAVCILITDRIFIFCDWVEGNFQRHEYRIFFQQWRNSDRV